MSELLALPAPEQNVAIQERRPAVPAVGDLSTDRKGRFLLTAYYVAVRPVGGSSSSCS